jgi:hypothetical protein
MTQSILVSFDSSCSAVMRQLLIAKPDLFKEADPAAAALVIFGSDEIDYLRHSTLFKAVKAKSICITESDIPTFALPGLYAANQTGFLTAGRTRSISYFISERAKPNPEIKKLIGADIEKRYLYSFMGGTNSWPRRWLFKYTPSREDTLVEATDRYNHWSVNETDVEENARRMRRRFAEVMAASKFSLCPRGCGLSSYRLFESMSLGIAPFIIADKWRPVEGVDWSFAVFVPEKKVAKIDEIVRAHASEWQDRGAQARLAYQKHFSDDAITATLHNQIQALRLSLNPAREPFMFNLAAARSGARSSYWAAVRVLKVIVLKAAATGAFKLPFRVYDASNAPELAKPPADFKNP